MAGPPTPSASQQSTPNYILHILNQEPPTRTISQALVLTPRAPGRESVLSSKKSCFNGLAAVCLKVASRQIPPRAFCNLREHAEGGGRHSSQFPAVQALMVKACGAEPSFPSPWLPKRLQSNSAPHLIQMSPSRWLFTRQSSSVFRGENLSTTCWQQY